MGRVVVIKIVGVFEENCLCFECVVDCVFNVLIGFKSVGYFFVLWIFEVGWIGGGVVFFVLEWVEGYVFEVLFDVFL